MFIKTSDAEAGATVTSENEESLGAFLRRARLSQGLELSAIALETRINESSLLALEENNRASLPADVFSRGFVKLYASYLKLDSQQAIQLYEKQWGATGNLTGPISLHRSASSFAWPGIIITLLLIALFFGVRIYYPGQGDTSGGQEISGSPLLSTGQDAVKSGAAPLSPSALVVGSDQPVDSVPAASNEVDGAEVSAPIAGDQTELASKESLGPDQETLPPPYEIRLQSSKKTKIKLALDGEKPVDKNLRPGSGQTWQAAKSFDLTVDGTAGIELTVNGATVPITPEEGKSVTIHRP